jgi:hypothetical protein
MNAETRKDVPIFDPKKESYESFVARVVKPSK